jgi:hypothetical protein
MQIGKLNVLKNKDSITWIIGNISVKAPYVLDKKYRNIIIDELKIKSIVFSKNYKKKLK